jgi:hypothetical protein
MARSFDGSAPRRREYQFRKIPPGELSIDPEADEPLGLGNRLGWSLVTKVLWRLSDPAGRNASEA